MYQEIGVEIRNIEGKGKGVFLSEPQAAHSTIWSETPIVSQATMWTIDNMQFCNHCLRSLEHPLSFTNEKQDNEAQYKLPLLDVLFVPPVISSCLHCDEKYCCDHCKNVAWQTYHSILCKGLKKGDQSFIDTHPLDKLSELCRNSGSVFPLMVAKIFAMIMSGVWNSSGVVDMSKYTAEIFSHKRGFALKSCEGIVTQEPTFLGPFSTLSSGNSHHSQLSPFLLQTIYGQQHSLLHQALFRDDFSYLFDIGLYAKLISAIQTNCQLIRPLSPWEIYLEKVKQNKDEKVIQEVEEIERKLLSAGQKPRSVEGIGIYLLHSNLNHSCDPNVKIDFQGDQNEISIVTKEGIEAGQEICFSYVPSYLEPDQKRDELLELYGFECECETCKKR
eukprot:TRINITY_DN3343_c0_g1_i1.p1 TRINITY_DN3343_c0_g1~~TRINITY_DN3343_c0_g1_i1.p1  ORF type:complete len:388 (-),score=68.38 TRINITY_DN3343_c0_g1_i1:46-1209(-)